MGNDAPPRWDRRMQQRLARGEAAALGELYDRFASLVHSLAHRVLDDEPAADRVTREVFGYIWENPDAYDPKRGSLRSWVATLTHRQAVHRLRQYEADSARACGDEAPEPDAVERKIRDASTAARADYIVTSMPAPLRAALELAYFQRRNYRQTAADLGVTEDEARRRLRLGLQLLSTAHNHRPQQPARLTGPPPPAPPASAPDHPIGQPGQPGRPGRTNASPPGRGYGRPL
ncbi:sigma-70 family RNA polymerase sigma factor [Streptomyces sp. MST-110588]|uniref:sigma-70 family RNA polymerase sigma factor n=1 Tax=Streptomyces sp. MST-110588 TaxID=2833628 RepID=UPI001F5C9F3A|nr:sigma-70 family RNA polymerase sigma factor [Streptomyces sp. MST-110588]UNO40356.1 sigma-70 family RNA polymerase sigma factor [Streptomyces sp. MST-110588]